MIRQKPEGGSQREEGLPTRTPSSEAGLRYPTQQGSGSAGSEPLVATRSCDRLTLLSKPPRCSFKGSLRRKAWVGSSSLLSEEVIGYHTQGRSSTRTTKVLGLGRGKSVTTQLGSHRLSR